MFTRVIDSPQRMWGEMTREMYATFIRLSVGFYCGWRRQVIIASRHRSIIPPRPTIVNQARAPAATWVLKAMPTESAD